MAVKKRTRPAGRISSNAEIVAKVFWPTNRRWTVLKGDMRTASDRLFGASMLARDGSDDRAYLSWLSEAARELHYGEYWGYHAQAGAQ